MKNAQNPNTRTCPSCHQLLPPDAPEGICPECAMMEGLATVEMAPGAAAVSSTPLPATGEIFGDYRIGRELGRGGMGAVFEAEQLDTGRRVALKLLKHEMDSPEAQARFLREGRLAASINHPNSVYVFGTEKIDEVPAIAMELVAGSNLQERVKEEGPMESREAVDAILQIISGLEAAQEIGILHRDIKPANCFEELDGGVKIGDFGLSISTEAREENPLTLDGTIFGTPAFASPEQLRGDELNARSDIYSVGATLYFLLAGNAPFRGKSLGGLISNVLEKKPEPIRNLRPEIPAELSAAINRCLAKSPSERFASYAELREALLPFSLDAPEPASVPLRLGAGLVDWVLLGAVNFAFQIIIWGEAALMTGSPLDYYLLLIFSNLLWIAYFGILEGKKGFSPGKLVFRLRVIDEKKNSPGIFKAAIRAFAMSAIPSLLIWIYSCADPLTWAASGTKPATMAIGLSYYAILGILFSTARRKNGFASMVDLWTKTRVIRRLKNHERPALTTEAHHPLEITESGKQVGPYQIIEIMEEKDGIRWLVGYDSRLLRKVWIRDVPQDFPPVPTEQRQLGRAGRLRWLTGRREEDENWDAFEYPGGKALLSILKDGPPPWEMVRYWLRDLATELACSQEHEPSPETLSLSRVWITEAGMAKLLSFTAPGIDEEDDETFASPNRFLGAIAIKAETPVPLHVTETQNYLSDTTDELDPEVFSSLIHRTTKVTRNRRAAMIAACMGFPVASAALLTFGVSMMDKNQKNNPEITALNQLLAYRDAIHSPLTRGGREVTSDRTFRIYIAEHFADTIENPEKWTSPLARMTITPEKRAFAESSLTESLHPTEEEIQKAEKELGPIIAHAAFDMDGRWWFPIPAAIGNGIIFIAIPAILSALIFKQGLVMLIFGVAVAKPDGSPASRSRTLWRSLVTWSTMPLSLILMFFLAKITGALAACLIGLALLLAVIGFSLWLPERGLNDRIAGTRLIPR